MKRHLERKLRKKGGRCEYLGVKTDEDEIIYGWFTSFDNAK